MGKYGNEYFNDNPLNELLRLGSLLYELNEKEKVNQKLRDYRNKIEALTKVKKNTITKSDFLNSPITKITEEKISKTKRNVKEDKRLFDPEGKVAGLLEGLLVIASVIVPLFFWQGLFWFEITAVFQVVAVIVIMLYCAYNLIKIIKKPRRNLHIAYIDDEDVYKISYLSFYLIFVFFLLFSSSANDPVKFWPIVGGFFIGIVCCVLIFLISWLFKGLRHVYKAIITFIFFILEKLFSKEIKKKNELNKLKEYTEYRIAIQIDEKARKMSNEEYLNYLEKVYEQYDEWIVEYNNLIEEYNQLISKEIQKYPYEDLSDLKSEISKIRILPDTKKDLDFVRKVIYIIENKKANNIVHAIGYIEYKRFWDKENLRYMMSIGSINHKLHEISYKKRPEIKRVYNLNFNIINSNLGCIDRKINELNKKMENRIIKLKN